MNNIDYVNVFILKISLRWNHSGFKRSAIADGTVVDGAYLCIVSQEHLESLLPSDGLNIRPL